MNLVLLILALVSAILATAGWHPDEHVNMIGLALTFFFASCLFGGPISLPWKRA